MKAVSVAVKFSLQQISVLSAATGFALQKGRQQELHTYEERSHCGGRNAACLIPHLCHLKKSDLSY